MRKLFYLGLIALAGIIIGFAWAEQITLTTYYPAPYGVYREFTTTSKTCLATNSLDADPDAVVGIGTATPLKKLEVVGGAIKATGGLIIHTVDSQAAEDALSLESGQIWLRTDINP